MCIEVIRKQVVFVICQLCQRSLRGDYDRNNRGETRVFVTHGPGKADRNVVSVLAGYKYKKQSDVTFAIDGKDNTLFTMDNRAWALPEDDAHLVTKMKRGNKLIVTGISQAVVIRRLMNIRCQASQRQKPLWINYANSTTNSRS